MHRWLILLTTLITVGTGLQVQVSAKSRSTTPTPNKTVLAHASNFYQLHETYYETTYGLSDDYQTAFDSHGRVWLYNQTHSKALSQSLKAAMKNWNQQLASPVFYKGTKKHHTLTVKVINRQVKTNEELAWWQPTTQTLSIDNLHYQTEWQAINKYMKQNYVRQAGPDLAKVTAAIDDTATTTARNVEYARILTHELGHVLGLQHSKNQTDLMYAGVGFSDIYQYAAVIKDQIWANPLSVTDVKRGQLALKLLD